MLALSHFQKSYQGRLVLNIDNIQLPEGIFWIKGKNGSGKSTLLKSIAGILSFDGNISLDDYNLKKEGIAYKKLVNFAEAEPVFPEFLTGSEMIALFAKAKDAPPKQEEKLIREMDMQEYLNHPLGAYSSGTLKKLSLVLAFLGKPRLILLDEPLNTIDSAALDVLYQWISTAYRNEKISFLLSSHQPIDAGKLPEIQQINLEHTLIQLEL